MLNTGISHYARMKRMGSPCNWQGPQVWFSGVSSCCLVLRSMSGQVTYSAGTKEICTTPAGEVSTMLRRTRQENLLHAACQEIVHLGSVLGKYGKIAEGDIRGS